MVAATIPDFDGLGIVFGVEYYQCYHHVFGHNVFAAVLVALLLAAVLRTSLVSAGVYFALYILHIYLDYLGSGPGWGMFILWPWSDLYVENPNVWDFQSWQNAAVLFGFAMWTFWLAASKKRTPFEWIRPEWDQRIVTYLKAFTSRT